jgi:hypothetical protein
MLDRRDKEDGQGRDSPEGKGLFHFFSFLPYIYGTKRKKNQAP